MLTDERYKQLMEDVGLPNSISLLQALKQCAMEAALIERAAPVPAMPIPKQEPAYYVNIPSGNPDGAHHFLKPAEWATRFTRCLYEPLYRQPQPAQAAAMPDKKYIIDPRNDDGEYYLLGSDIIAMLSVSPKPE